ncbi:hypothetical protein QHH11_04335 [Aphanizomenon sp. PH219]|nr:hypothetical protein [Aphanizomenon sp. 202]MDK2458372.1 hypothetical protein [Aphanizomenon sp. PH219]
MKILTPDGKTVISGSLDKTIKIWDLAMGRKRSNLFYFRSSSLSKIP